LQLTRPSLPDARGRTIAGRDDMGGSTASRLTNAGAGIVGTTLGVAGGSQTHTLVTAELASHTHGILDNNGLPAVYIGSGGGPSPLWGGTGGDGSPRLTAAAGSGTAHNNTQPTLVLNKIIKL
jgi:microcystin-dependent protein